MESKEELYHQGLNPHYFEAFDEDACARVLFALESLRTPYTRVPHEDRGVRSLRFYVQDAVSLNKLEHIMMETDTVNENSDSFAKYQLVYENSFV